MEPGIYEVISDVKIRREPRIVEGRFTNQVGLLKTGTQRKVYSIMTQKDNSTWGRVSQSDAAGIAEWACIEGLNRVFMRFIKPLEEEGVDRLSRLEAWARTMGYNG